MLDPEMRGWAIVVTNGVRFAGVLRKDPLGTSTLEQALEFLPIYQVTNEMVATGKTNERGQPEAVEVTRMRIGGWQLSEPLAYPSIMGHGLPVPAGALVIPVSEYMSQADMNMLARGIDSFHAKRRERENEGLIKGAH